MLEHVYDDANPTRQRKASSTILEPLLQKVLHKRPSDTTVPGCQRMEKNIKANHTFFNFCPQCGMQRQAGWFFCAQCGFDLKSSMVESKLDP